MRAATAAFARSGASAPKGNKKLAAITATFAFSPATDGGPVQVTGNTLSEVKTAALSVIAQRKAVVSAKLPPLDAAEDALEA